MNILYIGNYQSSFGGQPSYMEFLIPYLKERYKVGFGSGKRSILLRFLDFNYLVYKYRKVTDLILFDVYSSKYFYGVLSAAMLARCIGKPYICILHGGNLPARLIKNPRLSSWIFQGATRLVAPSDYLKEAFEKEGYQVEVIVNSVEHPMFSQSSPRKQIRPRMIYVRSLLDIYNPMMAVEMLKQLREKYPDAFLCMAGKANEKNLKELNGYIQKNNLSDSFSFKGQLTKDEWFRLSVEYDIYLSTTDFDNTPVSLLEAYNLGLLVASTNVGGVPYLVEDGTTGILFEPKDAKHAAAAIAAVIENQPLAKKICEEGFHYGQQFRVGNVVNAWYELLDAFNDKKSR